MPVFEYRVRDRSGKMLKSQVEADTLAQVRDSLRSKGLLIVDIKAPKTGFQRDLNDIKIPFLTDRPPGLKPVAIFSRQLATLINAGVPLVQALTIMQRQLEHKGLQAVIRKVRNDVESGTPFSEAIAKYPKVFSRLYINLVRAGETSGTLDSVLDRISDFQEKDLVLRGKLKSAMTYPVIVLVFALDDYVRLADHHCSSIWRHLAAAWRRPSGADPGADGGLGFPENQNAFLVLIVGMLVVAFQQYYKTKQGRRVIDDFKLKVPVFGTLLRRTAIASFARTFGLLLGSGVNIIEALDITKGTANNAIVEETLKNAKNVVMVGEQMSGSLAASPIFPPMVVSMVSIGEETGALDSMLAKVADFYDREVEEAVEGLTAAIEPIMIVFLGGIVGVIVAGMFLPMFSIINTLSK